MSYKKAFLGLSVRALNKIGFSHILDNRHTIETSNIISQFDFTFNDIDASMQLQRIYNKPLNIKRIIWFLPGINNPFWGGIHTILRFATFYQERYGVENCFAITGKYSQTAIRNSISSVFPKLKNEEIYVVKNKTDLECLPEGDISICTQWKTAFSSLKFNKVKRKFYFIQDYEPLFYPAGSISALIEETYRFGFFGITNTVSLKNIYDSYNGGHSLFFTPSIDKKVFYPPIDRKERDSKLVFFYARPEHPRNGFELGVTALEKLKKKLGDNVRIVTAGASWSPEEFGLDRIIENLGLMKYEETADLYRQCDAGLIMMFTRHPSYLPLELMACGCPVVTNYNPATTWLLHDKENCYLSKASASCIADTLHYCLEDKDTRKIVIQNGFRTVEKMAPWEKEMEKVFEYMKGGCSVEV